MRKRGKRINQTARLKPLGIRNMMGYELPTRAAIVAIEANAATNDHLAHLYSLGDMCLRMSAEPHIRSHSASVMRITETMHREGHLGGLAIESLKISAHLLLGWINRQSNSSISKAANRALEGMAA